MSATDFYRTPEQDARKALRYALNHGGKVWVAYGYDQEAEGWVLSAGKHSAEIQDATCGHTVKIAYASMTEMSEV